MKANDKNFQKNKEKTSSSHLTIGNLVHIYI